MSLRLTRRGALAIGALALAVPVVAVSTSAAYLSSSASITGNSVGTSSCTTSTWNTTVSGLSNVTSYMSLGGAATTPSSSSPTSSQTGAWTPSTVTTGASGALYCSSDTAVTFDDGADKIAAPNTVTFANWGLTSGSDTMALWFKGTSSVAGGLASVSKTGAGGWTDRGLWIDTGGYVVFGGGGSSSTATTGSWTIKSTGTYNDGQWHMVAVVMGNNGTNLGATLYVDGVQEGTPNTTGTYYATANGAVATKFQIGDVEKPVGITGIPAVSYLGTIDEFLLVNAALTAAQLSAAMPIGVTSASVAPTQTALTSATVGTSKAFSSISTTANSTDVISASIAPQATITSASISPNATVTAASVSPTTASVTAATVTTAQKSISSSTVQTTGAATKLKIAGTTGLKITAAVPGTVTYGTTAGWKIGDYVYVSGVAGCTVGSASTQCTTGYDTALNGKWYPISATGTADITVTVGTATANYFTNCSGAGGDCLVNAGTSKSQLLTMTAVHGLVAGDSVVINSASSTTVLPNGTYTVVSAPTTSTLTINPVGTSTFGIPTALTAAGTVTKPITSAVYTATNSFVVNDVVTVTSLSGVGASTVNVTLGTISAASASSFTVTIAAYAGLPINLSSQSGTAARTTTTATITAANAFSATQSVTISGLTGTNDSIVNGTFTIASATSTYFTITIGATTNTVAITAASGTAVAAQTVVSVTATNTYANSDTVTITGTGTALDNTSGTVANRTATGFTYTISNYSGSNIAATTGTAAVARMLVTVSNTDHGYVTGDKVTIAITGGNATLDGTWTITKVDANSFTYTISSYSGANLAAVGTASLRTTSVSSASITPNATITAASVTPQASITSASITPNATVTAATVTPTTASVTAATVTTAQKSISSSTVQTTGAASKLKIAGTTGLKITAAVPGTVTYGTTAGWKIGDYVYVSGVAGCTVGSASTQCTTGYDTALNGKWYPISATGTADITVTVGTATANYFTNCSGPGGDCLVNAGTSKSQLLTMTAVHGLVATDSVVIDSASNTTTIPNGTYTVVSAPTTSTLTINPVGTSTFGIPTALTAAGTVTKPITSAVYTATNSFVINDVVTVTSLSGSGASTVNVTLGTISARTASSFTVTIAAYAGAPISLSSQSGTAARTTTTATITAANTFSATQSVTISGLTGTNDSIVNGTFTIASATSTNFTITIGATTNTVAITAASGTATSAVTVVSVTAANTYSDGNAVSISGTGTALDNTSGIVANRSATGFTYTISPYTGSNLTATTGTAAVPQTTVSVTAANSFAVNDLVTISGTTGLDGGPYTIASATSTGFTYTLTSPYSGTNLTTSVGNAMVPETIVTVTASAHGYSTNDRITMTTTGTGADTLNGTFTITVTNANTFTYAITSYTGTNLNLTGTATTFVPVIKITGTGFTFTASNALTITGTGDTRLDTHVCTVNAAPAPTATTFYCNLDASITTVNASPAITGTLLANGTVVTVIATNTLTTSDTITIAGAGAPFNGTFPVASATGSQFTYTVASSAYVSASTGTFAKPITLATITTDAAHGLVATNSVTISGAGSPFDGTFTIVAAPTTTTFTINISSATGTPTSSSTGLLASKAGLYWAAQLGT